MKITKFFEFAMAHRLSNYVGKCCNLHGHTYKLEVTIDGQIDESTEMLLDFNILKKIVNNKIIEELDHAIAINAKNPDKSDLYLINCPSVKMIEFKGQTTTENLSRYIFNKLYQELMFHNYSLYKVKLWESPTSFAEYTNDDAAEDGHVQYN